MKANKIYLIVNFCVVSLVALIAFIISYNALVEVANSNGVKGYLAYLWPLLIDMPIIAFAINGLVNKAVLKKTSYLSATMMLFFSVASLAFNLAHAGDTSWLAIAVAIVPPVALIASDMALRDLVGTLHDTPLPLDDDDDDTFNVSRETLGEFNQAYLEMKANGLSDKVIASELGVSISTINRRKKAIALNGNGNI